MRWEFVNTTTTNPVLTKAARYIISKKSRQVGARTKKTLGTRKANTGQLPNFLLTEGEYAVGILYEDGSGRSRLLPHAPECFDTQLSSLVRPVAPSPLSTHLRRAYASVDLSVMMQPRLIENLLQTAATAEVNEEPRRWISLSRLLDSPLLEELPMLVGHAACLDDAIICITGRVRHSFLALEDQANNLPRIERSYGRALRALAEALNTFNRCSIKKWPIWYTTVLLILFELLDHSSQRGWITHAQGAYNVLEALGPDSIVTELERDVFIAQVELMILEAIFSNRYLFLERTEWQHAMRNCISESVPVGPRAQAAVMLWAISASIPGLFSDVYQMDIKTQMKASSNLISKMHTVLRRYETWHASYSQQREQSLDEAASQRLLALQIRALVFQALTHRLLLALQPDIRQEHLAGVAASHAKLLLGSLEASPTSHLHVRVAERVVHSIQTTSVNWVESVKAKGHILSDLFGIWCNLLGR